MTAVLAPTAVGTPSPPEPMPRRDQLAFMVFATWTIAGLFLDGWSHRHQRLETFFTPWHALLYSGFLAGAVVAAIDARTRRRQGLPEPNIAGFGVTRLGLVLFPIAGAGDFIWHQVFGIETDVAALLSPTHLLLMFAGVLALTGPVRAAWLTDTDRSPSLSTFLPVVVSTALAAALASFFTMFSSPFLMTRLTMSIQDQQYGVVGVLLSTVVLMTPALLLRSRWHTPRGTFVIYFTLIGTLIAGLDSFHRAPLVILPLLIAGVVTDELSRRDVSLTAIAAVVPAVMWSEFFAIFFAMGSMRYSAELWSGTVVMATLVSVGVRQLARGTSPLGS